MERRSVGDPQIFYNGYGELPRGILTLNFYGTFLHSRAPRSIPVGSSGFSDGNKAFVFEMPLV